MRIIEEFPPNYAMIVSVIPAVENQPAIFSYGEDIYNPHKLRVTADLEVHERVHAERQGALIEEWWYNYLRDPAFRLDEEIRAYGAQYAFIKSAGMSGKLLDWGLDRMADALCGALYGNLVTFGEARSKIRNFAKNIE